MIKVQVGTNTNTAEVSVNADATVADVIRKSGMDIADLQLRLNNRSISADDQNRQLTSLGMNDGDTGFLLATTKAKGGK